jgi:hypothetical protein
MATVLELESVYCDNTEDRQRTGGGTDENDSMRSATRRLHSQEDMEAAVLLQELCSIKEERADLK